MEPWKVSASLSDMFSCVAIDGNIDETDNMRIVVQSYKPKAVCVGKTLSHDIRESCESLLDSMVLSEKRITFGYGAGSRVRMPYSRISGQCS